MSRDVLRAILKGDLEKLESFRDAGGDFDDTTEKENWTYLHRALLSVAMPPSESAVEFLLESGADPNAVDSYGNTPLYYATRLENAAIMQRLLERGADVNHVNRDGISPLRECLLTRPVDAQCVETLLSAGADVTQESDGGLSVIQLAHETLDDDELIGLFEQYAS